jgi:hypothetical protein
LQVRMRPHSVTRREPIEDFVRKLPAIGFS